MSRRLHTWKIRNRELALGDRTLIMGVLNVTPDSFSDGGQFDDPDRAYARAIQMEEEGADIIDIGAESTRPGAQPISAAEELRRLIPVLKRLREKLTIPISVDTYKAEVAERALDLGAEIINDPSGFTFDPLLSKPVVQYNAGVIFNHMRGRPETWSSLGPLPDVMGSIIKDLDASVNRARRSGVERARIMVDPGIGFGKRREQNSEILARLGEMSRMDLPILVGASRKSFLAQPSETETEFATAAAVTASILGGAHMVRVHDVANMRVVVGIADEVLRTMQKIGEAREAAAAEAAPRKARTFSTGARGEGMGVHPPVRPPLTRRDVRPEVRREEPRLEVDPDIPSMPGPDRPAEAAATGPEAAAKGPEPAEERAREPRIPPRTDNKQARAPERPFDQKPGQGFPPRSDRPRPDSDARSRPGPDRGSGDRPAARWKRPEQRTDNGSRFSRPPRADGGARDSKPPRAGDPRDSRPRYGGTRDSGPPRSSEGRPPRPFDSRPPRSGEGRPSRPFNSGPPRSSDSRPPRSGEGRPARPFDSRPPRSSDSRPPRSGEGRPSRPFNSGPPRSSDSRPPRSSDSRPPRSGDGRPPRPFNAGPPRAGDSGPRGARPFRPKGPRKSGPPRDFRPRPKGDK